MSRDSRSSGHHLVAIKLLHTVVWGFFVAAILGVLVSAWDARFDLVLVFTALVMIEVLVLVFNGMQCPLTPIAARYTDDRRANFDIYLPEWLARRNKQIFGTLFVVGVLYALARWQGVVGPAPAAPAVQALLDSYAPDLRIGGRVSRAAHDRYHLLIVPYTGYRDSTYRTDSGVRDLIVWLDEYIDDGNPSVSMWARIERVTLSLGDTASIRGAMFRMDSTFGPAEVHCYRSNHYGATLVRYWSDGSRRGVSMHVRLAQAPDQAPPTAWDAMRPGTARLSFHTRQYGPGPDRVLVSCPP